MSTTLDAPTAPVRPTHSLAVKSAEKDLLLTLLNNANDWDRVGDILLAEHFSPKHAIVYQVIGALINACKLCNIDSVEAKLLSDPATAKLGATIRAHMASANKGEARKLATFLREQHAIRCIKSVGTELQTINSAGETASAIIAAAIEKLSILQDRLPSSADLSSFDDLIVHQLDTITEKSESSDNPVKSQGLANLLFNPDGQQYMTGLVVGLVGEKGTGKTTLATQIFSLSLEQEDAAVFFSAEMPRGDLAEMMLANRAKIPKGTLSTAALSDAEWPRLTHAIEVLRQFGPGFVEDNPEPSLGNIHTVCACKSRQLNLKLVVIDHLMCIKRDAQQTAEDVMLNLKAMARRLQCNVLVISHEPEPLHKSADIIWHLDTNHVLRTLKTRRTAGRTIKLDFKPAIASFTLKSAENAL